MKTKLSTKGLDESLELLAQRGADINQVAVAMLEAGGAVLVQGMQERAPKDTHNLEEHIVATPPKQDGNYVYTEIGLAGADAETARYGTAQEYGWADHTGAKAGQPYLRPTVDADTGKARKAMLEVAKAGGAA